VLAAHARNPSYLEGWDQEDHSLRSAWKKKSSRDPISKITREKWTGGVAQAVQHLLCKHKALSSNASPARERERGSRSIPILTRAWGKASGSAQSSVSLFINPWDALDNYWVFLCDHRKSKTLVNPCPKISPFNPFRGPSSHQSQLSTSSQYLISKYRDQEQCYISVIPATWEAEIGVQG
jgi:hypothetical protein